MTRLFVAAACGVLVAAGLLAPGCATAAVKTETVTYKQGTTVLKGYLAYDDASHAKRPGVIIFPAFMGISAHEKDSARRLAKLGYVAFVADIYGNGVHLTEPKAGFAEMAKYLGDRKLYRARGAAALAVLKSNPMTDDTRMAAIGYCFGGGGALELARSGAPLKGAVTFHGVLNTPTPQDAKNIKGRVLALHGADDPVVPPKEVAAFEDEMRAAKVDWELVVYSGAVHAFTDPSAGNDNSKGAAYNATADKRSWVAMTEFLHDIFVR